MYDGERYIRGRWTSSESVTDYHRVCRHPLLTESRFSSCRDTFGKERIKTLLKPEASWRRFLIT